MLILLNGPPGVGKSTLAGRYLDDHPLALRIEIDEIRCSLGGWQEREDSKQVARDLAVVMGEAHLRAGYDVIVPQYLGRTEFILTLEALAERCHATFREVLLVGDEADVVDRFRARRADLAATGRAHPQLDVDDAAVSDTIAEAITSLEAVVTERPGTQVVTLPGDLEATYSIVEAVMSGDPRADRQAYERHPERSDRSWSDAKVWSAE